jgi:WD40 repeat protein
MGGSASTPGPLPQASVLAAVPRFSRRRLAVIVVAAVAAAAVIAVAVTELTAPRPVAALADPGAQGTTSLAFSPDGKLLAAADGVGKVYVWRVTGRSLIATFNVPGGGGYRIGGAAAFSPDSSLLAVTNGGGAYVWSVTTRTITALPGPPGTQGVDSLAFSPDGKTLAAGDADGQIYLWSVSAGRWTTVLADPAETQDPDGAQGATSVAFSPNGKILATGYADENTDLWSLATRWPTGTLADATVQDPAPNPDGGVTSVAFSPGGGLVAAGDSDGDTYVFDAATQNLSSTLTYYFAAPQPESDPDAGPPFLDVAFSRGGTLATCDSLNGDIYLWNDATHQTGVRTDPSSSRNDWGCSVAFSPDGGTLAESIGGSTIYLWRVG